jgi:hypothetical protein
MTLKLPGAGGANGSGKEPSSLHAHISETQFKPLYPSCLAASAFSRVSRSLPGSESQSRRAAGVEADAKHYIGRCPNLRRLT